MGYTLADGNNRSVAPSAPAGARARTPAQGTQQHRRVMIICASVLSAAVLTPLAIFALQSSISAYLSNSLHTAAAMQANDLRTAKITKDSDGKECWQQTFDNQTGRMTKSPKPCETTTYDSHGDPVPLGTIHRLDAISKSFSGH